MKGMQKRKEVKRVLVIGPSETRSCGGMAQVIRGIRESAYLSKEFKLDSFPSYIDGSLPVRLLYSAYAYIHFLFRVNNYDLFHIHVAERGSTFRKNLYLKTAKRAGKKVIIHIHGAEYLAFYDGLGRWGKRVVDHFFHQADRVLVLSKIWKKELEARIPMESYKILHNGIDTACFASAASSVEEYQHSFFMLGRLGKRKGVYDLIDAVELAVQVNPKIKLCLAGDGEIGKVRELIAQKGLGKHIALTGWISGEEKLRRLKHAATLVLPSYDEGLPIAILEGMAAGKAILSTTVGAIPEVVGRENGILVTPGDIPALTEGLLRCSSDTAMLKQMSKKNREKARGYFDIRQMHEQLAEYYREAAGVFPVKKGEN